MHGNRVPKNSLGISQRPYPVFPITGVKKFIHSVIHQEFFSFCNGPKGDELAPRSELNVRGNLSPVLVEDPFVVVDEPGGVAQSRYRLIDEVAAVPELIEEMRLPPLGSFRVYFLLFHLDEGFPQNVYQESVVRDHFSSEKPVRFKTTP